MAAKLACTKCRSVSYPRSFTPGSTGVELVLWLFFLIPGIIYGVWRVSKRTNVCGICGSDAIVPLRTPEGIRIQDEGAAVAQAKSMKPCPRCLESIVFNAQICRHCQLEWPFLSAELRSHVIAVRDLVVQGKSDHEIVRDLNDRGLKCLTGAGAWGPDAVTAIRKNFALG